MRDLQDAGLVAHDDTGYALTERGLALDGQWPEEPKPEKVAQKVKEKAVEKGVEISEEQVRSVAWEVVPDMAEVVVKERIRELENQVEEL